MILLRVINYNMIFYHLYYLGIYQDEGKNERSTKSFFMGMEPNPGKPDRSEVVRVMWGFL